MMVKQPALAVACALSLLVGGAAAAEDDPPYEVSGRYPRLAMFNSAPECGIGALALWQGRLYAVTYAPHAPTGSDDKLYILDADLRRETFPGSVGGTPANRMIHRESRQLLIGPYLIDEDGGIRVIPPGERPQDAADGKLYGRITANARHLTDPANKVYYYDMEGLLYEVDVRTLDVALRYVRPIPGWHAKGAYTGQGRLALGANGEHAAGTATPETFGPSRQRGNHVSSMARAAFFMSSP